MGELIVMGTAPEEEVQWGNKLYQHLEQTKLTYIWT